MVEQEGVISAIESMLGDQTHRTVEIEGWTVKTDIKKTGDGFSVEKTYGSSESRRYVLGADGTIRKVLLFENVGGELLEPEPVGYDQEVLNRIVQEALEHA